MDNGHEPATKKDLLELEQRLTKQLTEQLTEQITERLTELVRDTETSLLRAFHDYAEGNHHRMIRVEAAESTSSLRLAELERRVLQIEKRLAIPGETS